MKMWIKLTKAIQTFKADEIVEVDKAVGDAYIAAGFATETDATAPEDTIRKEIATQLTDTIRETVAAEVAQVLKALKRPNVGGVDIGDTIEPGEAEADKTKSDWDFVRCVVVGNGPERYDDMTAAQDRLRKVYKSEFRVEKAQGGSSGGSGGWLLPVTMETAIQQEEPEEAWMIAGSDGVTEVPMTTRQVSWPTVDQYQAPVAGQSAMYGGVQVYRKGESQQRTETNASFNQVALSAKDLTALVNIDRDTVLDSGGAVTTALNKLIGGAVGWRRQWEWLFGNGTSQSLGITKSKALIVVGRETTNTITFRDARRLYRSLLANCRKKACWVINPYSIDVVMGLKDDSGRLIYLPWYDPAFGPAGAKPSGRLLGLPLIESEMAPPLGTPNDLMLIHRPSYLAGSMGGMEIGMTDLFRYDLDQLTIKVKLRDDGAPRLKKPITLADGVGNNKVSAFVGLDSATAA